MVKFVTSAVVLLALVSSVHLQDSTAPNGGYQQPTNNQLGGLLPNLFGNSNGGLGQTLSQLPSRGMQALNNVLNGIRNMLPLGIGRNYNQMPQMPTVMPQMPTNMPQMPTMPFNGMPNPMNNMPNPMNNMPSYQNQLPNAIQGLTRPVTDALQQGRIPDQLHGITRPLGETIQRQTSNLPAPLNNMAKPLTDALQQGRLPDLSSLTQGLGQTTNGLTNNLQGTLSNLTPNMQIPVATTY